MRTRPMVAAILAVVVSAGCGASDDGDGLASADQLVVPTTTRPAPGGDAGTVPDGRTAEEAFLAFAACMRDEGIVLNDPEFEADGTLRLNLRGLVVGDVDEEEILAARAVCDVELEGITQAFEREDRSDIEDQLFAYAACMRENGYDMPDPIYVERTHTPGQGGGGDGGPFGKLDRTDPEFIEANDVCQVQFDDLWMGSGGGPGGGGGGEH